MKTSISIISVLFLLSCAGPITGISCVANISEKEQLGASTTYLIRTTILTSQDTSSQNELIKCTVTDSFCGGGNWRSQWKAAPDAHNFRYSLNNGSILNIDTPNCTTLNRIAPTPNVVKNVPYGSVELVNSNKVIDISIKQFSSNDALNQHGAKLLEFSIERKK